MNLHDPEGILGHGRWRLRVLGQGKHASATLMEDKNDPWRLLWASNCGRGYLSSPPVEKAPTLAVAGLK